MIKKRRLMIGMIAGITVAFLVLLFLYVRSTQAGLDKTAASNKAAKSVDFTGLDSILEKVPEYYSISFDEAVATHLSNQLEYVEANRRTMTQATADIYAHEIQEILQNANSFDDIPQVYIKVEEEGTIQRDYTSAQVAIADSKDGETKEVMDLLAQIKVRGNSTAEVAKKSYTIKLSEKQDVLGMGKAKKWVLNANAFDKSLLRNKLALDFASAIGLDYVPACTFADVWLNGSYIGNYLLSELVEVSPSRVDINTDSGDYLIELEVERNQPGTTYFRTPIFGYRFGVTEPKDLSDEQLAGLTGFLEKVETAIEARNWESFCKYVDIKSYIDFYILSEVFKVVDFDYSSTRFYIKNNILYAGPPWDYDLSSGNADRDFYFAYNYPIDSEPNTSYNGLWCNANLYLYCYEFPEFKDAFRKRYIELQELITNLYEDNSIGTSQIDGLLVKYKSSFDRNYSIAGWTLTKEFMLERNPDSTYQQNVEYLRDWLKKRNEFLLKIVQELDQE